MADRRPARVAQRVQAELAHLLLHDVRDPRLHEVIVSDVRMTADLRVARVYVRSLAPVADPPGVSDALGRAAPFLRARLGERLKMRYVPELRFEYDDLQDDARRLEELLRDDEG